ncbi:D-alanyl-D-alanine carboxypeptidase family protein [Microbacterium sp. EYE_5]|uniref:M15 family metallopeptidase n=1 Tax=unclassified Microbacterium TaxID=2609290 RepID=UPI002002D725|nr:MULTISPECIES: M15 family metallopeptidase [unclassified Microbacterium]MCK6079712.1 D-alanyl-D-alanine carboxypeptidase family protein [Microbacterium sp. EYE_382]MCK6084983.1 D-alanyl-D-alanine carboxypeptidase family protein [Microbacterium sp. EYE_384]MCK6122791.1 D-alanyl-D-alanine carboxypeptidase family protein [Microbacterium sp. EYE_80]MCK6125746.1 D-alanyl-D-alanine carboxypeptidase family protein [Microbacterium sp. EYE_79]MCK6140667.1 D-alanyl-D-alanine carboxypeptidase family pr
MSDTRSAARRRVLRARRRRRALVILTLTSAMIVTIAVMVPRALSQDEAVAEPASTPTPTVATEEADTPEEAPTATPAAQVPVCETDEVAAALEAGSDADVIAAFGGGGAFRAAVAGGDAPCIDLHEAGRVWVVANKRHALDPIDYWPTPQARPQDTRIIAGGWLLDQTAAALDELSADVRDAAGTIGVSSGFRPYDFQVDTYNRYVGMRGREAADLRSARPGHSEHQTGLAVDVVACDSGCGDHDGFGGTPQSDWIAENAWRYGFVVRYEEGHTDTTGYSAEPWHLRFIGRELAAAYAEGGFRTLEEFFGLEPAPDYG